MNVLKYVREKKQAIKEYARTKDLERDHQRTLELKRLKEERAILNRKGEVERLRKSNREQRHPILSSIAKKMGDNVKRAQAKAKPGGFLGDSSKPAPSIFGGDSGGPFSGEKKKKKHKPKIKRRVIVDYE